MQSEDQYVRLLSVLLQVGEANRGLPAGEDDRILDAEGLAQKVIFHASSVLYLSRSTTLREIGASFFDPASMNVLGRAALEAFLVFHYVFVNPKSDYERTFDIPPGFLPIFLSGRAILSNHRRVKKYLNVSEPVLKS